MARFLLLGTICFVLGSCATIKQNSFLKEHQILLSQSSLDEANPEQQFDDLSTSLVKMIDQSLDFADPRKGMKFIQSYSGDNKESINHILQNVESWTANMEPAQKLAWGIGLLRKPQVKELIALIPKFKRKYNQVSFLNKVFGRLSGSVIN